MAEPVVVPSSWLVALTVTTCAEPLGGGAVYRPILETEPAPGGLIDQATAVFRAPTTVAVNCCVCRP